MESYYYKFNTFAERGKKKIHAVLFITYFSQDLWRLFSMQGLKFLLHKNKFTFHLFHLSERQRDTHNTLGHIHTQRELPPTLWFTLQTPTTVGEQSDHSQTPGASEGLVTGIQKPEPLSTASLAHINRKLKWSGAAWKAELRSQAAQAACYLNKGKPVLQAMTLPTMPQRQPYLAIFSTTDFNSFSFYLKGRQVERHLSSLVCFLMSTTAGSPELSSGFPHGWQRLQSSLLPFSAYISRKLDSRQRTQD